MAHSYSRPKAASQFRSGFTLIELLVVIAIIAILASILFPVFGRARENARRSSCQSNLKQLGLVMMQYSQDYDEYFPMTWTSNSTAANTAAKPWMLLVQPYVKNVQILQCPSASEVNGTATALRSWRNDLGLTALPTSYAYNYYVGGGTALYAGGGTTLASYLPGGLYGVKKLAQVTSPSEVIMMADGGSVPPYGTGATEGGAGGGPDPADWKPALIGEGTAGNGGVAYPDRKYTSFILVHGGSSLFDSTTPAYGTPSARHFGTTDVLWADGHVKAQKMSQLMELTGTTGFDSKPTSCFHPYKGCSGGS